MFRGAGIAGPKKDITKIGEIVTFVRHRRIDTGYERTPRATSETSYGNLTGCGRRENSF